MTTHDGPATGAGLTGRYDDARALTIEASTNHEVAVTIGHSDPMFLDALDLLRVVSHVALDLVYGPSPPGEWLTDVATDDDLPRPGAG
jgi:hypothetical protein